MNEFNFTFNVEELNLLLSGLGELPAKQSLQMINKIQQAVATQQKASSVEQETTQG